MNRATERGFREVDHTADWELEVWAPDFPALVEEAAAGLASLMGVRPGPEARVRRRVRVAGDDREELLVAMLSELLYLLEDEGLVCDDLAVREEGGGLTADAECAPAAAGRAAVKAVTYHRLAVRVTSSGLAANLVFDV